MPQHTLARLAKLNSALAVFEVLRKVERLQGLAVDTPEYAGLDAARTLLQSEYNRLQAEYEDDHDAWKERVEGIIAKVNH